MSVIRISPIKKASINDSTPTTQPPIGPKPKPKPRRMKSVPSFQTGLPDTEGKSLGTHVCYMRQKELLNRQYYSPNHHSVIDSRLPSQIIPEVSGELEDHVSNSESSDAPPPPPPPASTIPICPTELSSSPINCTDRDSISNDNDEETTSDQKGIYYTLYNHTYRNT